MSTVLKSLTKKIELSNIGEVYSVVCNYNNSTEASIVNVEDPRYYKDIFKLDTLGIEKSLKSCLIEVKDSILRLYYVLDSSCFYIDFDCSYQTLESIQELPVEAISYFRILFSKKSLLQIRVYSDILYIDFEDSKKKGEKVGKKYTLELPLRSICELDTQVVELVEKVVSLEGYLIGKDIVGLPLNYESIKTPNTKEPIDYWGTTVRTEYGDFIVVDTSGLLTTTVICPALIGKNFTSEINDYKTIPKDADVDYEDDMEESVKLDNFMESSNDY